MTLNHVMADILRHFPESGAFGANYAKPVEARTMLSATKM